MQNEPKARMAICPKSCVISTEPIQLFNVKRKRVGHLFQGRYKAILVETDEYAKELSRYIYLNPVRAGIVEKIEQKLFLEVS